MGISDLKVFGRLAAVFGMQLYSHCLAVCVWAASSFHLFPRCSIYILFRPHGAHSSRHGRGGRPPGGGYLASRQGSRHQHTVVLIAPRSKVCAWVRLPMCSVGNPAQILGLMTHYSWPV